MPTGVLRVSHLLRERVRAALPSEHSVRAVMPGPDWEECEYWMIEGPMMPGDAQPVHLLMMLTRDPAADDMTLRGTFTPIAEECDGVSWIIDRWPDLDTFRDSLGLAPV
jgi:hypothetical protein